jgi:hypothetical protein
MALAARTMKSPANLARAVALASIGALASAPTVLAQGANDCFAAEPLAGAGTYAFSTIGATTDGAGDGLCLFFGNNNIFNDVWFRFTATDNDILQIATCGGTALDTKIAIYAGADCASPVVACSDDDCGAGYQSKAIVAVSAGQEYLVRLGAFSATGTGTGTFTIGPAEFLGDVTDKSTGIRYVAVAATSWTAAEALAVNFGGHLVSIGDQAEQDFVHSNFGNLGGVDRRLWIGFSDTASEGSFAWSDGTPAKYTNWNGGEPNNSGGVEDFAEMLGSNGRWNDLNDAGAGYAHLAVIELPGGGGGGSPCPADLNDDRLVDAADLSALLLGWGGPSADLDGNGVTDAADVTVLLVSWGPCPN